MFQNTTLFNQSEPSPFTQWDDQQVTSPSRFWEISEYAKLLNQLDNFLASVLRTTQVPFDIRIQWGREVAVRNPIRVSGYQSLVGFLPSCGRWMDLYWADYHYSPDLQLYFDCFVHHPFASIFVNGVLSDQCDHVYIAKLYNDFINYLRLEAVRRGVAKALLDWRYNLIGQEQSIRSNLGMLQSRHGYLIPVRVDLYYSEFAMDEVNVKIRTSWEVGGGVWSQVTSTAPTCHGRPEVAARIDSAIAMADRDRFFANQRGTDSDLFEHMVGYICKLEQGGVHRANHFHCVFFFDGARVTQAQVERFKFRIGDRWHRVTHGHGLMFDCHARADRPVLEAQGRWVLDTIKSEYPTRSAQFVDYLVGYFAKDAGQMVRIKPTQKARTLTMGR